MATVLAILQVGRQLQYLHYLEDMDRIREVPEEWIVSKIISSSRG